MMYRAIRHVKIDNSTRMITGSVRLGETMYIARARTGSMCTSRRPDGAVDGGLLRRLGDWRRRRGRICLNSSCFCRFQHYSGFALSTSYYSNNLPLEATAYLNSSSRSLSDASSHNVADANARAQSMATPREFTMHSFDATGDAYSSIASTR